jgi:hypothetical protein
MPTWCIFLHRAVLRNSTTTTTTTAKKILQTHKETFQSTSFIITCVSMYASASSYDTFDVLEDPAFVRRKNGKTVVQHQGDRIRPMGECLCTWAVFDNYKRSLLLLGISYPTVKFM